MTDLATTTSREITVRADIGEAHQRAWGRIAAPGTWWTGAERVAIAAECRRARSCGLCTARKAALSPYGLDGEHEAGTQLGAAAVEAVHRLTTDPGRLKKEWLEQILASGELTVEQYVELVGVVTQTLSMDFLRIGLGQPLDPLPDSQPGEPSRRRPGGAAMEGAWVPMVQMNQLDPEDEGLFGPGPRTGNVIRAMSLVPDEVRALRDLSAAYYLATEIMMDFATQHRSITRPQIELIAGRVSALNECFY